MLQRCATFGQLILIELVDQTQRHAEAGQRCQSISHVCHAPGESRWHTLVEPLVPLPETMCQPAKSPAERHQLIEKRNVQRAEFQYPIEFALEHHNRYAFNTVDRFR